MTTYAWEHTHAWEHTSKIFKQEVEGLSHRLPAAEVTASAQPVPAAPRVELDHYKRLRETADQLEADIKRLRQGHALLCDEMQQLQETNQEQLRCTKAVTDAAAMWFSQCITEKCQAA